jgi:hypothetical protein
MSPRYTHPRMMRQYTQGGIAPALFFCEAGRGKSINYFFHIAGCLSAAALKNRILKVNSVRSSGFFFFFFFF